ncbi:MAG: hypothetical protein DHS20C15_29190 [Planctomycetota bacterium]|nr:MAG: hypothetical protein DHS20C15_29190 [Planctomycetota bacterium]
MNAQPVVDAAVKCLAVAISLARVAAVVSRTRVPRLGPHVALDPTAHSGDALGPIAQAQAQTQAVLGRVAHSVTARNVNAQAADVRAASARPPHHLAGRIRHTTTHRAQLTHRAQRKHRVQPRHRARPCEPRVAPCMKP